MNSGTVDSGIQVLSARAVPCFYWRCLIGDLWTGLAVTKLWCQLGEATLASVCSIISQTSPIALARNALPLTSVLFDPNMLGGPKGNDLSFDFMLYFYFLFDTSAL